MTTNGITLLVVDSSSLILNRFQSSLEDIECVKEIFTADSVVSALELLKQHTPDVFFLDFHVDYGRGSELLKQVKQQYPGIKVVMLCNEYLHAYRDFCFRHGADGYFDKSIDVKQILAFVKSICDNEANLLK
jgi:DNA-binding NarL/FixJ family response regulator